MLVQASHDLKSVGGRPQRTRTSGIFCSILPAPPPRSSRCEVALFGILIANPKRAHSFPCSFPQAVLRAGTMSYPILKQCFQLGSIHMQRTMSRRAIPLPSD